MEWTNDFLQGDGTKFIFGNAFFHNLGDGQVRGDLRPRRRRELLALGAERR